MTNGITNKMSERTRVNMTNADEPVHVMTRNPKKVVVGNRLAEWRHKNKEKLAQVAKAEPDEAQESESNLSCGVGAVRAVGVLGLLGYYISKKGDNNDVKVTPVRSVEVQT